MPNIIRNKIFLKNLLFHCNQIFQKVNYRKRFKQNILLKIISKNNNSLFEIFEII
jgi:hypothetical protein